MSGTGIPPAATVTPGAAHESEQVTLLLRRLRLARIGVVRPRTRRHAPRGKGYSYASAQSHLR